MGITTRDNNGIIFSSVYNHKKFNNKSIVFLMHSKRKTAADLDIFIEFLLKNNFQFKPLYALTKTGPVYKRIPGYKTVITQDGDTLCGLFGSN